VVRNFSHLPVENWEGRHGAPGCDHSLRCLAPSMFVAQFDAAGRLRYSLAGSAIQAFLPTDVTGRTYLSFWHRPDHAVLRKLIAVMVARRKLLCITARARLCNRDAVLCETILMPVSLGPCMPPMTLGIQLFLEEIGNGGPLRGRLKLISAKLTDHDRFRLKKTP
jgi:hypothetical protein